jgi:hypothetical protein
MRRALSALLYFSLGIPEVESESNSLENGLNKLIGFSTNVVSKKTAKFINIFECICTPIVVASKVGMAQHEILVFAQFDGSVRRYYQHSLNGKVCYWKADSTIYRKEQLPYIFIECLKREYDLYYFNIFSPTSTRQISAVEDPKTVAVNLLLNVSKFDLILSPNLVGALNCWADLIHANPIAILLESFRNFRPPIPTIDGQPTIVLAFGGMAFDGCILHSQWQNVHICYTFYGLLLGNKVVHINGYFSFPLSYFQWPSLNMLHISNFEKMMELPSAKSSLNDPLLQKISWMKTGLDTAYNILTHNYWNDIDYFKIVVIDMIEMILLLCSSSFDPQRLEKIVNMYAVAIGKSMIVPQLCENIVKTDYNLFIRSPTLRCNFTELINTFIGINNHGVGLTTNQLLTKLLALATYICASPLAMSPALINQLYTGICHPIVLVLILRSFNLKVNLLDIWHLPRNLFEYLLFARLCKFGHSHRIFAFSRRDLKYRCIEVDLTADYWQPTYPEKTSSPSSNGWFDNLMELAQNPAETKSECSSLLESGLIVSVFDLNTPSLKHRLGLNEFEAYLRTLYCILYIES